MSWLGIDVGTSAVKTVIADERGEVVAEASAGLETRRPAPLWSEQDPEDWVRATTSAVRQLPAFERSTLRGVGLSGQMHGAVLLDAHDEVLRPAILWNDGRSAKQCEALDAVARRCTGNPALPGFTAPKLAWVRDHEPAVFRAVRRVLLPKDYLRLRITGDAVSEMSDASGTLWLDVARRRWSEEMLEATGVSPAAMPTLIEGNAVSGTLRTDVAAAWGLPRVPVAGGAGDQAAGAIGAGVVSAGDGFLSLGTSGAVFTAAGAFVANPDKAVHAFCHALPGRWHTMAVILSAAASLDWVARLTGYPTVEAALSEAARHAGRHPLQRNPPQSAQQREPSTHAPLFLPYLSGERTPLNDPRAQGVFFGLTHETERAALVLAVLEGVGLALRDALDALTAGANGSVPRELRVIGGGARSPFWVQMLSDILGVPLALSAGADVGPAYGAARLARLAVDGETPERVCVAPAVTHRFTPRPEATDPSRLARFRSLYASLQRQFRTPDG